MGVGGDYRGQRAVRDLEDGISHTEEHIGDSCIDAGSNQISLFPQARKAHKHQHAGQRQGQSRVQ